MVDIEVILKKAVPTKGVRKAKLARVGLTSKVSLDDVTMFFRG